MGDSDSQCRLGDVADLVRGVSFRPTELVTSPDQGVPLLRATNIGDYVLDLEDVIYVPHQLVRPAQRLRRNDIVIAMSSGSRRAVGRLAPLRSAWDGCVGAFCGVIRPLSDRVDPQYLGYVLRSATFRQRIETFAVGTAIMNLSRDRLLGFEFRLPPREEQRRIASILGALDDKIEVNRRLRVALEATARTLFKSWFVAFDVPEEFSQGAWVSGTLADLAALNPEVWPTRGRPDVLRYVDLSGTKWGRIETVTDYPAGEAPSRAQRVLRPGDTIIGTVRPGNGSYAMVMRDGLTGSTGFAQLRPKRPRDAAFVYLAATARGNIEALAHVADGGAYPAVRPALVAETPVIVPDDRTLNAFSAAAGPLLRRAALATGESETLATMRDALLPGLLSGQFEPLKPLHAASLS